MIPKDLKVTDQEARTVYNKWQSGYASPKGLTTWQIFKLMWTREYVKMTLVMIVLPITIQITLAILAIAYI